MDLIFFRQLPSGLGIVGIIIVCSGAYILNIKKAESVFYPILDQFRQRHSRMMLWITLALGLTTVCDKLAIDAASAFTYTLIWSVVSAVLMGFFISRKRRVIELNGHSMVQACFWAGAFLCQMLAVEHARCIQSGVTYVKALTMLSILMTVAIGGHMFRENDFRRSLLAAGFMVAGAVIVVLLGI